MKRSILYLIFLLVVASVSAQNSTSPSNDLQNSVEKINTLLYQLDRFYVDSFQAKEVAETVIKKTLEELDPHSVYIPKEELKKMNEPLKGKFEGIGIQFNILKDTIIVVNPIPGGPSEKLGIRASDKIIEIEGENVAGIGIKNSDVIDKLRGKKGTVVNVGIARRGEVELLDFSITRDNIPIFSVDAGFMVSPKTGYIKVNRFAANTVEEFKKELAELKAAGMDNLIIDLQGNGGGYLNTAVNLADELLEKDKLIVYTEGRSFSREDFVSTEVGNFEKGKLIVLIDESSASASEIVSGAVQDWDRGIIIGRRSFGKGLVQKPFGLPDGAAVRMTVSRYYTPSGRCIQKPYDDGLKNYFSERYTRYENGEMFSEDSIKLPDSLKFFTSNKRPVYGGGGIIPDIFVPLDTSNNSPLIGKIVRKGIINTFSLNYVDAHREKLMRKYSNMEAFKKNFVFSDVLMDELKAEVAKEELDYTAEEWQEALSIIQLRMKAFIARNLYDNEAFYYIISDINESLQKALEIIDSKEYKKTLLVKK